jgi:hypothetical protein
VLFSHTSHTLCARALRDETHRDVFAFMNQIFVYIFIEHNCMNHVLGNLKKQSCTDNPLLDNREYTMYYIR